MLYEEFLELESGRRREAALRTGHIVAMIHNRWRQKGEEPMRPTDLLRGEDADEPDRLSPEEAVAYMRGWARSINEKVH